MSRHHRVASVIARANRRVDYGFTASSAVNVVRQAQVRVANGTAETVAQAAKKVAAWRWLADKHPVTYRRELHRRREFLDLQASPY